MGPQVEVKATKKSAIKLPPTRRRSVETQKDILAHIGDTGNVGTLNGSLFAYACTHELPYPPQVFTAQDAIDWLDSVTPRKPELPN